MGMTSVYFAKLVEFTSNLASLPRIRSRFLSPSRRRRTARCHFLSPLLCISIYLNTFLEYLLQNRELSIDCLFFPLLLRIQRAKSLESASKTDGTCGA